MTEQDIINYLKNHPTFFANHLELLFRTHKKVIFR